MFRITIWTRKIFIPVLIFTFGFELIFAGHFESRQTMRVYILHSGSLKEKAKEHYEKLRAEGNEPYLPFLDTAQDMPELEICKKNLEAITNAEEVHVIWDGHSRGSIFDFGMTFALKKPIKLIYIEPKSIINLMKQYENDNKK
jgi:hypothetical protein